MNMTIKDIAAICQVSHATVSKVLNNNDSHISSKTREWILYNVKKYNYIPNGLAKGLKINRSNMLGFILPDITNPFFPEIARGIEDKASERDYGVLVFNADGDPTLEKRSFDFFRAQKIDGIVFAGGKEIDDNSIMLTTNIPMVLVDRSAELDIPGVGRVCIDTKSAMDEATQLLVDAGCQT